MARLNYVLNVELVWKAAKNWYSVNPIHPHRRSEENVPSGFGPDYKLPYSASFNIPMVTGQEFWLQSEMEYGRCFKRISAELLQTGYFKDRDKLNR